MSTDVCFHDIHASGAIEGLIATAREGVFTYKVFVSSDALRELGAEADEASWLATFRGHEQLIAACASVRYRNNPNAAVCIATFEAR